MVKWRERRGPFERVSRQRAQRDLLRRDPAAVFHANGLAAYAAQNFAAAVEHLGRAVSMRPENALWHTHLGAALRRLGRLPEAIEAHRRAVECKHSDDCGQVIRLNAWLKRIDCLVNQVSQT